jgi:hypothetical protein
VKHAWVNSSQAATADDSIKRAGFRWGEARSASHLKARYLEAAFFWGGCNWLDVVSQAASSAAHELHQQSFAQRQRGTSDTAFNNSVAGVASTFGISSKLDKNSRQDQFAGVSALLHSVYVDR